MAVFLDVPPHYWLVDNCINPHGGWPLTTIPADHVPSITDAQLDVLARTYGFEKPLHAYVASQSCRRSNKALVSQVLPRKILAAPFLNINEWLAVACPELTFLKAASTMNLHELIIYGCELCAKYALKPNESEELPTRTPITTPEALGRFLDAASGAFNVTAARKALPYIKGAARSPKEIETFLLLSLPHSLGGYGITDLEINPTVSMHPLAKRPSYELDMYSPSLKVCIEYHGKTWHSLADSNYNDANKRKDLQLSGIPLIEVVKDDFIKPENFQKVARGLFKAANRRLRIRCNGYEEASGLLWSSIRAQQEVRDHIRGVKLVKTGEI